MGPLFTQDRMPSYHPGMLMVRMREPAARGGATFMSIAAAAPQTSGVAALSFYERAGLVKRVTPLRRGAPAFIARTALSAGERLVAPRDGHGAPGFAAARALLGATAAEGGTAAASLVELERGEDVRQLQMALAADPLVASVSRVPVRYLAVASVPGTREGAPTPPPGIAAIPPNPNSMWNLRAIRWAEARGLAGYMEPSTVKVAVLDTGVDDQHPDLRHQIKSYIYQHPDLPGASSSQDIIGHGTHVAGTIAATINNKLGTNGICQCEIHAWKIFDDKPDLLEFSDGTAAYVYYVDPLMYRRALLDCADQNIDVVNLSIGGPGAPDEAEADAFEALIGGGTTVVAAMGNERRAGSPISYPAAIPGVIAVGATNLQDRVTAFSNRGNHITVAAPGDAIWSTLPTYPGQTEWEAVRGPDGEWQEGKPARRETDYDAWPGTSMATPHVAGAVAVFLANGGERSPSAVRSALAATADKVPAMEGQTFHPDYGYGG